MTSTTIHLCISAAWCCTYREIMLYKSNYFYCSILGIKDRCARHQGTAVGEMVLCVKRKQWCVITLSAFKTNHHFVDRCVSVSDAANQTTGFDSYADTSTLGRACSLYVGLEQSANECLATNSGSYVCTVVFAHLLLRGWILSEKSI